MPARMPDVPYKLNMSECPAWATAALNRVVREIIYSLTKPPIAPAPNAEPIWIGDFLINKVINTVHQVLERHSAPVPYFRVQFPCFASDTSSVWEEDHIAI